MNILAIECSGKVAGVAVSKGNYIACELSLDGQLTHSQVFLPMLEECLRRAGMDYSDIDGIVCNIGPGSFTGVRIGCSTANALGLATGAKLIAVNALESLVHNVWAYGGWVVPILDARADRVYAGIYRGGNFVMEPSACNVGSLLESLPQEGEILLLGEGAELHFQELHEGTASRAKLAPMHLRRHRASTLADLGRKKLEMGDVVDRCLPLYLRPSQAEQEKNCNVH